jgi:hypothetical protein
MTVVPGTAQGRGGLVICNISDRRPQFAARYRLYHNRNVSLQCEFCFGWSCLHWSFLLGYQEAASRVERPRFIFEDVAMQNTSQETDNLRAELDRATHAIKGLSENLALWTTKLESVIDKAIAQAEKSSQSASKLARSLNVITCCLVRVGVIQILIYLWHR